MASAYCSAAKSHCSALSYFAPSLKFFLPDLPPPKTVTGRLKQIARRNTSDVRRLEYFFITTSDRHLDRLRPGVISITSKKTEMRVCDSLSARQSGRALALRWLAQCYCKDLTFSANDMTLSYEFGSAI